SIKKPGGFLTGTSDQAPIDKQVQLLGQAVPNAKTVGILYNTSERNSEVQVETAQPLLEKAGYKVVLKGISNTNEVQDAVTSLMKDVDAVFIPTDNTVASTMTMIGELSVSNKVPVIGGSTDMVDEGGLLTYGTNYEALGRQTAKMALKILEGAQAADMAVEYPETVSLHVNEEMAKKLGIDTSKLTVKD
ncbi:ABC transporter substrate-binding protein, partial [Streptococcus danieliae]|nr:ABC transporter substrate-binding protein [Streptococcus danieliae]